MPILLAFLAQAMTSILNDTVERQPDGGQAGALANDLVEAAPEATAPV